MGTEPKFLQVRRERQGGREAGRQGEEEREREGRREGGGGTVRGGGDVVGR